LKLTNTHTYKLSNLYSPDWPHKLPELSTPVKRVG